MTIEQMKEKKLELGLTAEMIADQSGVPVSTVRKIFSGATKAPRKLTIDAIAKVLNCVDEPEHNHSEGDPGNHHGADYEQIESIPGSVKEPSADYGTSSPTSCLSPSWNSRSTPSASGSCTSSRASSTSSPLLWARNTRSTTTPISGSSSRS